MVEHLLWQELEQIKHQVAQNVSRLQLIQQGVAQIWAVVNPVAQNTGGAVGKPILCLDFDGVIHSYTSGWKGADVIPDPPVEGAIAFMLDALNHFDVVIFSSRSHQAGGTTAMMKWLCHHAGAAWYKSPAGPGLEDVHFASAKPSAMITLDDRALNFDGTWPTMQKLKEFKPWNKR